MRIITLLITLFAFGITPLQAFSYFSFKKYQVAIEYILFLYFYFCLIYCQD